MAFTIDNITDGGSYGYSKEFIDIIIKDDYLRDNPNLKSKIDYVITQRGNGKINIGKDIVSWEYDGETLYGFKSIENNQKDIEEAKDNLAKLIGGYEAEVEKAIASQVSTTTQPMLETNPEETNPVEQTVSETSETTRLTNPPVQDPFKAAADEFLNDLTPANYQKVAKAGRPMQVFETLQDGTVIYIEPERTNIEEIKTGLRGDDSIDEFVRDCQIAIKTKDGKWLYARNINEVVFAKVNTDNNITGAGYDIDDEKRAEGDMEKEDMKKGDQAIIDILSKHYNKVPSTTINAPPVLGRTR